MKIFVPFLIVSILITASVCESRAQPIIGSTNNEKRTVNIPEVIIKGRRLTLSDILDSVASQINRKKAESHNLSGTLNIEFLSFDKADTLYKASIPVCIKPAKSYRYEVLSKCGELRACVSKDSLSSDQRKRLSLNYELSSISRSYIKKLKTDFKHSKGFFAVETSNNEVFYRILLPFSVRISLAVQHSVSRVSNDTTISFKEIVINRKNWTIVEISWKVIGAKKSVVKILDSAQSYLAMRSAIEEASREKYARMMFTREAFTFDNGVYYPKSVALIDNLYNFSGSMFSRAANEEGSFYLYSLSITSPSKKTGCEDFCPFSPIDLMHLSVGIYE